MVSIRTLLVVALLLAATGVHGMPGSTDVELSGPADRVAEGYFQLSVEGLDENQRFRVQMSDDADFLHILAEYQPTAMFRELSLSGFDSGVYYFRAVSNQAYSNTVRVEVGHYPLWQAFTLFGVGLLMFAVLCLFIVYQHRRHGAGRADG